MSSNGKTCAGCGKDVSRQKQHTDPATQQLYCEPCWQKRAAGAAGAAGSVAGKSRAAATAVLPAEATPQPAPEPTQEAGDYEPADERMPPPRVSYPVTAPPKWVLVAAACWVVLVVAVVVVVIAIRTGSRGGRQSVARRVEAQDSKRSAAVDETPATPAQSASGGAAALAEAPSPAAPERPTAANGGAAKSNLVPSATPAPTASSPPAAVAFAPQSPALPARADHSAAAAATTAPSAEPGEEQVRTIDLVAAAALPAAAVNGDWKLDGSVLTSSSGAPKDRAKIRFAPPPADAEYDYSITFTATGEHPYVVQVLSFKGRPFAWMMLPKDSAFGLIKGKAIKGNPSAVRKGIAPGTRHTSVVKVRKDGVAAFVDGNAVTEWRGGYGDFSLAAGWDLGPTRPLGVGTECPITIESASLTVYPAHATNATDLDRLAGLISNPWATDPAGVDAAASEQQPDKVRAQIDRRAASTQPAVASAARRLKEGLTQLAAAPAGVAAGGQDERFLDVLMDASNRVQADAPARPEDPTNVPPPPLPSSGSASPAPSSPSQSAAAPLPILGAPALAPLVGGGSAAPRGRVAAEWQAERARLGAWDDLVSHANDVYPRAAADNAAVKLQLNPPDPASPRGAVAVTNATSHPLTHVTLRLELTHYLTAPAATARQFYFIPQWQPGQTIYLSATCVPNLQPTSAAAATPPRPRPISGGLRDDPWLGGAGGLLAASLEMWSAEAHQPAQTVRFEQNLEPCAKRELAAASRAFNDVIRRALPRGSAVLPPTRLALPDNDPLLLSARAAAQHVVDVLPASSPLVADAKALLKDPVAAARQEWKQQLDPLVAALPANKIRQGTWTLRPAEKGGTRESGKVTLAIESRSAGGDEISATVTAPDQPNVHQKMIGRVEFEPGQDRLIIHLRNPAIQPAGRAAPDYKLPAGWTNLYLVVKDQKLVGAVRCGPGTTGPVLEVTFNALEDKPANKPKAVAERAGSLTTAKPAPAKPAAPRAAERAIAPAR